MKKILILSLFLLSFYSYSQNSPCKTDAVMNGIYAQYPEMKTQTDYINNLIKNNNSQQRNFSIPDPGSITIPTVIYVIHEGANTPSYLSDTQVLQQFTALNDKFLNTGIKFCLGGSAANTDVPMKNFNEIQSTKGIIHIQNSSLVNNNPSNTMALLNTAHPSVTAEKYMRIWVVNSIDSLNSTVLGYAWIPGGNIYDGIVIRNNVFGNQYTPNLLENYDDGETLVHEVGHYLGLYHPFEGGCSSVDNDYVSDTPKVNQPNYDCIIGINSCTDLPDLDLIHNYMDYGDNICTDSFTDGQKQRMIDIINQYRTTLVSKENIIATGTCGFDNLLSATINANKYTVCANNTQGINFSAYNAQSWSWNFGDGTAIDSSQNPTHIYTSAVNSPYTVTLTVTGIVNNQMQTLTSTTQITVVDCGNFTANSDSYWYVGLSHGLNFNSPNESGVAKFDENFPQNNIANSIASQADSSGNLLFYISNNNVFNSQHVQINTTPLFNYGLGTVPMIVPRPGTTNQYYIFTSHLDLDFPTTSKGFRRSLVTIVNGLATMSNTTTNIAIPAPAGGYMTGMNGAVLNSGFTAVQKCNGDYWIICEYVKNTNTFNRYVLVYTLNNSGLTLSTNAVVTYQTGSYFDYYWLPIKASPSGNKLFFHKSFLGGINVGHLFDFDKTTGKVSDLKNIPKRGLWSNVSSSIFSPDSRFLYLSECVNDPNHVNSITQINLDAPIGTDPRIKITPPIINTNSIGDLQIGPDKRLYFVNYTGINSLKLGMINKPNILATNLNPNVCEVNLNGVIRGGNIINYNPVKHLPNLINAKYATAYPTADSEKISKYLVDCNKYKFFPNVCSSTFKWEFKNTTTNITTTSTLTNPVFQFVEGNYTIKLMNSSNTLLASPITLNILPIPTVTIVGSSSACTEENPQTNNSVVLTDGQTVVWTITGGVGTITGGQNTNASVNVNWTTLPGQLTAKVMNKSGCESIATKTITSVCCQECLDSLYWVTLNSNGTYKKCVLPFPNPNCTNLNMKYTWKNLNNIYSTTTNCSSTENNISNLPTSVKIDILDSDGNVFCNTSFGLGQARNINQKITDFSSTYNIDVFPNPSIDGKFNIKIYEYEGNIKLSVFDLNGRLLFTEIENNFQNEKTIDLSQLNSGVYLFKIENENFNYLQKIIKN